MFGFSNSKIFFSAEPRFGGLKKNQHLKVNLKSYKLSNVIFINFQQSV